jgi:hypothetical protein
MTTATQIKAFEVGKTYSTRSACDYDCVFSYTVVKRSAKFITVRDKFGKGTRCGVSEWNGAESAFPEGRYSMAPSIQA